MCFRLLFVPFGQFSPVKVRLCTNQPFLLSNEYRPITNVVRALSSIGLTDSDWLLFKFITTRLNFYFPFQITIWSAVILKKKVFFIYVWLYICIKTPFCNFKNTFNYHCLPAHVYFHWACTLSNFNFINMSVHTVTVTG